MINSRDSYTYEITHLGCVVKLETQVEFIEIDARSPVTSDDLAPASLTTFLTSIIIFVTLSVGKLDATTRIDAVSIRQRRWLSRSNEGL